MRLLLPCFLVAACTPSSSGTPVEPSPSVVLAPLVADCVQLPVGPPDGAGYRVAQGFGDNDHLGEDWNGLGGGNTDKGDPVHAMASGLVVWAGEGGPGWGPVVIVRHQLNTPRGPESYESLYAHLDRVDVKEGTLVERGGQVGTIGDAHGAWIAHLHLEVRDQLGLGIGRGYSRVRAGWVDPRAWTAAHRTACTASDD